MSETKTPDTQSVSGAARAADAAVVNGVARPPAAKATAPGISTVTVHLPEASDPKAPKVVTVPARRSGKQDLARRLVRAAATIFDEKVDGQLYLKGMTQDEAKQQVSNWLEALPTGGDGPGPARWWPEDVLPRPATTGWRLN